MSAWSDWQHGAISEEEYRQEARREARWDEYLYEKALEDMDRAEMEDEE